MCERLRRKLIAPQCVERVWMQSRILASPVLGQHHPCFAGMLEADAEQKVLWDWLAWQQIPGENQAGSSRAKT